MKFNIILMLLLSVLIALPAAAVTLAGDDVLTVQVDQDIGGSFLHTAVAYHACIKQDWEGPPAASVAGNRQDYTRLDTQSMPKTFNSGTYMHRMQNSRRCG